MNRQEAIVLIDARLDGVANLSDNHLLAIRDLLVVPEDVVEMVDKLRAYCGVPPFVQREAADMLERLAVGLAENIDD